MDSVSSQAQISNFPEAAWEAIQRRDATATFFYAVRTTGIFCRPGCASRLPHRKNLLFFATPAEARAAGFRPCLRCTPEALGNKQSQAVERMRHCIEANLDRKISLEELGQLVGLSPHAARRLFVRSMGTTPLAYQRGLRAGRFRQALAEGGTVTDAIYEAGYGSSSRAYEGAPLGMTPARFAAGGKGENIGFTAVQTEFGWIAVGATERGLCWLALAATRAEAEATVRNEFPAASLQPDNSLAHWVERALASLRTASIQTEENLDLRGTAFQLRVWEALRKIPRGETRTYSGLAREMGSPQSTRAVARACAMNRVSLLVPCHRVVGASGALTGYRWGVERKKRLLLAETLPKK